MSHPAQVVETNLWNILEGGGWRNIVLIIQAVTEAKLNIESGRPGQIRARQLVLSSLIRVILAKMPVLMIDVHFNVERKLSLARVEGIAQTPRVKDDLRIAVSRNRDIANVRDRRCNFVCRRVIRETTAEQV